MRLIVSCWILVCLFGIFVDAEDSAKKKLNDNDDTHVLYKYLSSYNERDLSKLLNIKPLIAQTPVIKCVLICTSGETEIFIPVSFNNISKLEHILDLAETVTSQIPSLIDLPDLPDISDILRNVTPEVKQILKNPSYKHRLLCKPKHLLPNTSRENLQQKKKLKDFQDSSPGKSEIKENTIPSETRNQEKIVYPFKSTHSYEEITRRQKEDFEAFQKELAKHTQIYVTPFSNDTDSLRDKLTQEGII